MSVGEAKPTSSRSTGENSPEEISREENSQYVHQGMAFNGQVVGGVHYHAGPYVKYATAHRNHRRTGFSAAPYQAMRRSVDRLGWVCADACRALTYEFLAREDS